MLPRFSARGNICVPMSDNPHEMLPVIPPPRPKRALDRRGAGDGSLLGLFQRIQKGQLERRSFKDRRATPRVPVELECEEMQGASRYVRVTNDLSTFGLSTKEGPTPMVGSRLQLKLFLPDEPLAPLQLEGEVLGSWGTAGGMRLTFRRPSLDAIRRIHRFLTANTR